MKRDQTSGLKWVAPPTEIQYSKRKKNGSTVIDKREIRFQVF